MVGLQEVAARNGVHAGFPIEDCTLGDGRTGAEREYNDGQKSRSEHREA
jgi:hypothetical protein